MPRNLKTWAKWTNFQKHNSPKVSQEEAENLNRMIIASEIEAVNQKLLAYKSPGPDGLTGKFYQTFG